LVGAVGFGEEDAVAIEHHRIVAALFDDGLAGIGEGFEIGPLGLVDGFGEDSGKVEGGGVEELDGIGIPGGIFVAGFFVDIDEGLAIEFDGLAIAIGFGVGIGFGG